MTLATTEVVGGKQVIRVRAIIVHDGKLLVVRHVHNPFYAALPGGHLEFGEDLHTGLRRELVEELGVEPVVGQLLYVNSFTTERDNQPLQVLEFFFAVENATDFLTLAHADDRSHAHELALVEWVDSAAVGTLRPAQLRTDFAAGTLLAPMVRFITS